MMIKLLNGDYRTELEKIEDNSIDLIITDPPYGILPNGKQGDKFTWDKIDLIPFTNDWYSKVILKSKDNTFILIFWSQKFFNQGIQLFNPHRVIFWRYDNLVMVNSGDFAYDYEPILVIKVGKPKLRDLKKVSCDFHYTKPQSNFKKDKAIHPTQKPLELIQKLVTLCSDENDTILDMFMGSGTTGVACKIEKRNFIGIELDKNYFELASNRIGGSK